MRQQFIRMPERRLCTIVTCTEIIGIHKIRTRLQTQVLTRFGHYLGVAQVAAAQVAQVVQVVVPAARVVVARVVVARVVVAPVAAALAAAQVVVLAVQVIRFGIHRLFIIQPAN